MRSASLLVLVFCLATPDAARAEPDLDGFITWEQWEQNEASRVAHTSRADDDTLVHEQLSTRTHIRFGAGPSYLVPAHLSSRTTGDKLWPEFSVWVAPFGRFAEIGADLSLGKEATLLFRPGVKLYAIEHDVLSLYLEATAGIYSHQDGTEIGGGCGAGLIIGLMDNLTVELHGSVTAFSLADDVLAGLLGQRALADASAPDADLPLDGLTLIASFGARLMTRF